VESVGDGKEHKSEALQVTSLVAEDLELSICCPMSPAPGLLTTEEGVSPHTGLAVLGGALTWGVATSLSLKTVFFMLGMEPRASYMQSRHSTT
jgi:hypothetical protein